MIGKIFGIPVAGTALLCCFVLGAGAEEAYGPPNLLKTMPTPFTAAPGTTGEATSKTLEPRSLPVRRSSSLMSRLGLSERLVPSRLYLPGRMILGKTHEFVVKGKAGFWVALAMADKNTGAKEILGHRIRLGPDRKLVSLAKIPETGVLTMFVDTPIQGDLVGQNLYFEAALWSKPDFSDLEIAQTISSEQAEADENGVLVAEEGGKKRGLKFVPDSAVPLSQRIRTGSTTLDSGKP